jgi:hypothetical protein
METRDIIEWPCVALQKCHFTEKWEPLSQCPSRLAIAEDGCLLPVAFNQMIG